MIKNIIFDLSEVIISGYHGIEHLIEQKYDIVAQEFKNRKRETLTIFFQLMRGNLTEEEYWKKFLEGTNWEVTVEDLKSTIREYMNQPIEGTMELIKKLKGKYRLILLSDHVREWMDYVQEKNQDIKIFDQVILSYKIGSLKCDEQTFKQLLKQNQIIANETLFIDDLEVNINRAEETGIHGILFQNANQLKEELEQNYHIQIN